MRRICGILAVVLSFFTLGCACSAPADTETESPAQTNYVAEAHKGETTDVLLEDGGGPRGEQPEEILPEAKLFDQEQQVRNGDIQLTFQTITYYDNVDESGIQLGEDAENYWIRYDVIDESGQCLDHARIAMAQVNIANLSEKAETISLMEFNLRFYEPDTGNASVTREVDYADPLQSNDDPKKMYEYTFEPGEDVDFTLGYVLRSEDVERMEKGELIPTMEVNNRGYLPTEEMTKDHLDEMAYIELPIPEEED